VWDKDGRIVGGVHVPSGSIQRRLVVSSVALVIVAFIISGVGIYQLVYRPMLRDLTTVEMRRASDRVADHVRTIFARVGAIAARNRDWGTRGMINLDDVHRLNGFFVSLFGQSAGVTSVVIAEDTGHEVLILSLLDGGWRNRITNPDAWGMQSRFMTWNADDKLVASDQVAVDYDARKRPWFTASMARPESDFYWTPPYKFISTGELGMSVVVRWHAPDGHGYAMATDIRLLDLTRFTQAISVGKTGVAAILTDDGRVVAVPHCSTYTTPEMTKTALLQPLASLKLDPLNSAFVRWQAGGKPSFTPLSFESGGDDWLTSFEPIHLGEQVFWIATLAPSSDFRSLNGADIGIGLAVVLGSILVAALGAVWLARRLTRPIERLTAESARIGRMELAAPIGVRSAVRDIDALAQLLEKMRLNLAEAQREIETKTTQEREAERILRESRIQLLQSQKMEAVGQLTGGVAHDFNNLLGAILGNLQLVDEDLEDQPGLRKRLQSCMRAVERGANLTRSLLAFSRQQPLQPRVIDVKDLVREVAVLIRSTVPASIDVQFVSANTWLCEADPGQLQNALLNLVANARDAMPAGGRVTIETRDATLDSAYAERHVDVHPGDYVVVVVSDTGAGMTQDVIDRAFEPFFTTKAVGKGTGLGLSMVYGFAKQSLGHATIQSEIGRGTAVRIYLPRNLDATEAAAAVPVVTSVRGQGEGILLVEDDDELRNVTAAQLRALGYKIWEADSGAGALRVLGETPGIVLMLTDVVLPGHMNGPQLVEAVLARRPELKVIYMSGYTENAIMSRGRIDPGVHLLQKPFRAQELAALLRRLLETAVNEQA
jgi:signal transduction histidine kinase/ActR/RegA family two-component response regulator